MEMYRLFVEKKTAAKTGSRTWLKRQEKLYLQRNKSVCESQAGRGELRTIEVKKAIFGIR